MPHLTRLLTPAVAVLLAACGPTFAQAPAQQPPARRQPPQQPPAGVKSKVKVTVPQDDAELAVEQKKTSTTGKAREFDTPEMEAGKRFVYEFKATWKPNKFTTITRTREVKFTAGDAVEVDLTKEDGTDKAVWTLAPPTDDAIAELVKAAKVTKDDVATEPGGADARTLIAAVKVGGAKSGVLVQPNADKVKAANEQIKKAELEGKVLVQQAEPADGKDYASATVVFLYVPEDVNKSLRPVLLRDLKPGARIVSYRFKMGDDWPPADTVKGVASDGDYEIHTWTVTDEDKKKFGKK